MGSIAGTTQLTPHPPPPILIPHPPFLFFFPVCLAEHAQTEVPQRQKNWWSERFQGVDLREPTERMNAGFCHRRLAPETPRFISLSTSNQTALGHRSARIGERGGGEGGGEKVGTGWGGGGGVELARGGGDTKRELSARVLSRSHYSFFCFVCCCFLFCLFVVS